MFWKVIVKTPKGNLKRRYYEADTREDAAAMQRQRMTVAGWEIVSITSVSESEIRFQRSGT